MKETKPEIAMELTGMSLIGQISYDRYDRPRHSARWLPCLHPGCTLRWIITYFRTLSQPSSVQLAPSSLKHHAPTFWVSNRNKVLLDTQITLGHNPKFIHSTFLTTELNSILGCVIYVCPPQVMSSPWIRPGLYQSLSVVKSKMLLNI